MSEEKIIICRCEDVTLKDLLEAMESGYRTLEELKMYTRLGMGHCQGRTCMRLAAGILAKNLGVRVEDLDWPTVRPPVLPIRISKLSREDEG